jgi:nicotinamidase-related amidase
MFRHGLFLAMIGLGVIAATARTTPPPQKPEPQAAALDNPVLLIIDIQNFYFDGGRIPLVGCIPASLKAKALLETFRVKNLPVIHIAHMPKEKPEKPDPQYDIHKNVAPSAGEAVIVKHYANSFKETDLDNRLRTLQAKTLVICGMQTHMCVEAATRFAADAGYKVILVEDACATRDLTYKGTTVKAAAVHAAVLAALNGGYAKVVTVAEIAALLK